MKVRKTHNYFMEGKLKNAIMTKEKVTNVSNVSLQLIGQGTCSKPATHMVMLTSVESPVTAPHAAATVRRTYCATFSKLYS